VKELENQLGLDKVTAISLVAYFLEHSVHNARKYF